MYRTIQKLPGFRLERLNLWETRIFLDQTSFTSSDLYYPSLLGYLYNRKDVYSSFLASVKPNIDRLQAKKRHETYEIDRRFPDSLLKRLKIRLSLKRLELKWRHSDKSIIVREYFKSARKHRQSKRLVEKTPHHYLHVHQILWTFPHAYIIWMIRHPIETITSSLKRAKIDADYPNYWQAENFVQEYRGNLRLFEFYKKEFPGQILLVKYEDFVAQPIQELQKICRFIEESFVENALKVEKHEQIEWKSDPYLFSNVVNKTEKNWHEHLSIKDAKTIETALRDLMDTYRFMSYFQAD